MEKLSVRLFVFLLLGCLNSRGSYLENTSTHLERISQEILLFRFSAFYAYCLAERDACMEKLPHLTRHFVFKHVTQIPALLEFVEHLPSIEISSIAYSALLEDFSHFYLLESQYLVQLMLIVKQTMLKDNFQDIDETYKNLYFKLKTKFPPKLMSLIWSDMNDCTISSVEYEDEFLYTTSAWHNFGTKHRANYLWHYEEGELDDTARWRLRQHGDKLQIFNKNFWTFCLSEDGPLLSSLDNQDCQDFYLHPSGDVFKISKESEAGYLCAAEVVNHRRRVRFVDKTLSEGNTGLWYLNCTETQESS